MGEDHLRFPEDGSSHANFYHGHGVVSFIILMFIIFIAAFMMINDHHNTNLARVRFSFSSSCDGEASHRRGVRLRLESGDGDYNYV